MHSYSAPPEVVLKKHLLQQFLGISMHFSLIHGSRAVKFDRDCMYTPVLSFGTTIQLDLDLDFDWAILNLIYAIPL